jgi:hypothetical protein
VIIIRGEKRESVHIDRLLKFQEAHSQIKPREFLMLMAISTILSVVFNNTYGNKIFEYYTSWNVWLSVIFVIFIIDFIGYLLLIIWKLCSSKQNGEKGIT